MRSHTQILCVSVTAVVVGLVLLGGCQKAAAPPESGPPEPAGAAGAPGADAANVSLSAEDQKKLGVATVAPKPTSWNAESGGMAAVVSHDGIAQAVAELAGAQAADRQSRAAVARAGQLADSAGALSAEARESAERQAGLDAAALALAQRRLSSVIGEHPTWPGEASGATLSALASGHAKLIRATFPLGSPLPQHQRSLRLRRIAAGDGEPGWEARAPWPAPADPSVPGRSFFVVLSGTDLSEGERLEAWAPTGNHLQGWLIPASAVVQTEGKYWCYVETAPGKYRRIPVDIQRPLDEGYFVSEGFDGRQHVVNSAAALLLARELNPSSEAE
jgi:hypothetical protein